MRLHGRGVCDRRELQMQTRGEFASVTAAGLVLVTCAGPVMLTVPEGWRCSLPRRVGDAHRPGGLEMLTAPEGW